MRTASTSSTSARASSSSVTGSPTIRNSTSTSWPWWNALNSQFSAGCSTTRPAAAMASLARSTSFSVTAKSASWLGSGAPRAHDA